MNRVIVILSILAVFSSCRSTKTSFVAPPVVELNNSDSVRVETVIKTEYIPVEADVDLPQQSESNTTLDDSSHVETELAFSDAWIVDGILHHIIKNKTGKLKGNAFVPQTTEHTNKEAVTVKEVPVPEPYPVEVERELTLMEQIKLAAFWYLVGAVIVSIGLLFRKPLLAALRKVIRL